MSVIKKRVRNCELDRRNLWCEPVKARKDAVARALRKAKFGLQLNEHFDQPGYIALRHDCMGGLDGLQRAQIEVSYKAAARLG
jgi:hypothetical protein